MSSTHFVKMAQLEFWTLDKMTTETAKASLNQESPNRLQSRFSVIRSDSRGDYGNNSLV